MEKCYNLTKNKDKLVPKYRFKLMGVCDKYESNWEESDDWNKKCNLIFKKIFKN